MSKRISLLVFLAVFAATAYPPAAALLEHGTLGAFRYLAPDSFYYLAVADHSIAAPFFTFDGSNPTNGFHPLWQLYLERSFSTFGFDGDGQILFAAISSLLFTALGTALFALALLRLTGRPALALLGSVPGFFYLLMPRINAQFASQWSFANGMESPLSILIFGTLAYLLLNRDLLRGMSRASIVGGSALLTLLTLARLDDIFIFAPFLLLIALTAGTRREVLRRLVAACAIPTVVIGAYLIYNTSYAGSALPSSGAAKAEGLGALARNIYALLTTLAPFADPLRPTFVFWNSEAWRIVQMVVPALLAGWWLLSHPMRSPQATDREWQNTLIGVFAGYAILKAAYNFTMVGLWHQGHWYYPVAIMVFNLMATVWCARMLDALRERRDADAPAAALARVWPQLGRLPLATVASAALVLVTANTYVDLKNSGSYHKRSYEFWQERTAVLEMIDQQCAGCGVLAFDDGIVSFALGSTPTLNGLGLAIDQEANQARKQGELLALAWQRGVRFLASVNYEEYADPATAPVAGVAGAPLRDRLVSYEHLRDQALDGWHFDVAFRSPHSAVSFLRFRPAIRGDVARAELEPAPPPTTTTGRSRKARGRADS